MKKFFFILKAWVGIFLLSLMISGCSRRSQSVNSIQIKGSDTMVNLGQAWAEEFMKRNPKITVAVTGGGSGTGISALISNSCDIAEVSREMKESEMAMARKNGIEPFEVKVALDGLAVVVHPGNPVSGLTIDQLSAIFSGKISNWKDLGGNDLTIVILSREVNSGTHVYFKEHVLRRGNASGREEFAPGALLLPSSQAIADEVAQNPAAIGYFGMGYITARQKTVAISTGPKTGFVSPSMENVLNNAYPISRPLLMYTKGRPAGVVREFVDFILSDEGQKIVARLDFVPVRKQ